MAVIAETHAARGFYGDDLDPEEFSARLGGQPSSCARKGDVIRSETSGRERIAKTGRWILRVERREPGDLDGQIEEILSPLNQDILDAIWERPILKRDANGIHGTLYFNYEPRRRHIPTTKREVDLDDHSINPAQRKLFAERR